MANSSEDIEAKLNAWVEGELDAEGAQEIERHLQANPRHRQLLADLQASRRWLTELPRARAPDDVFESAQVSLERSALLDESIEEEVAQSTRGGFPLAALAAVLVLAITLGTVVIVMVSRPDGATPLAIAPSEEHEAIELDETPPNQGLPAEAGDDENAASVPRSAIRETTGDATRDDTPAGERVSGRGIVPNSATASGGASPRLPASSGGRAATGTAATEAMSPDTVPAESPADAFARLPDVADEEAAALHEREAFDETARARQPADGPPHDARDSFILPPTAGERARDDQPPGAAPSLVAEAEPEVAGGAEEAVALPAEQVFVVITAQDPSLAALNVSTYLADNRIASRPLASAEIDLGGGYGEPEGKASKAAPVEGADRGSLGELAGALAGPQAGAGFVADDLDAAQAQRLVEAMNMPAANQSAVLERPEPRRLDRGHAEEPEHGTPQIARQYEQLWGMPLGRQEQQIPQVAQQRDTLQRDTLQRVTPPTTQQAGRVARDQQRLQVVVLVRGPDDAPANGDASQPAEAEAAPTPAPAAGMPGPATRPVEPPTR